MSSFTEKLNGVYGKPSEGGKRKRVECHDGSLTPESLAALGLGRGTIYLQELADARRDHQEQLRLLTIQMATPQK